MFYKLLLISAQAKHAILRPDTCIVSSRHHTLVSMKSASTSQFNCISTQDTNTIRPSIHADCIGVLGLGVGAQTVAAGGPKTAGEGTPETPEIEVFFVDCYAISYSAAVILASIASVLYYSRFAEVMSSYL